MQIDGKEIGGDSLYFIVEEGMANKGDIDVALRMSDQAKKVGADAIEFQFYKTNEFCTSYDVNYELYTKWELSVPNMSEIVAYTKSLGLSCSVALLSTSLVKPLIDAGCSSFNVNATDLTNPDIIDAVSESGKPFFLSLLIASENEIDWAINRVLKKRTSNDFALLHGQHTMFSKKGGSSLVQTELGCIKKFSSKYNVNVGFIDHTPNIWTPACGVAAGAKVITKHLSINKNEQWPDWHICLEPEEMRQAIEDSKRIYQSMQIVEKNISADDKDKIIMRRSIVASSNLLKGNTVKKSDICFKRPGTGITPMAYDTIVGRTLLQDVQCDMQIKMKDFK